MEIFGNGARQSRTGLRFGFDPRTVVFLFCGVFWYHSNSVTNREGTKRCPVFYGSEIWGILCVIVRKINNISLCVKFGCGCMVLLFTILGECVVSSEMGPRPKSRLTV